MKGAPVTTSFARDLFLPGLMDVEGKIRAETGKEVWADLRVSGGDLVIFGDCDGHADSRVLFTGAELEDGSYKEEFGPRAISFMSELASGGGCESVSDA